MQLQIHLHQRLLHVLNVGRGVFEQSFSMPKIRAESNDLGAGPEAGAEQAVRMQLLDPLRVVDIGLPSGNVLRVTRIHENDLETTRLEISNTGIQ